MNENYSEICAQIPEFKEFKREEFFQAVALANTRSFGLTEVDKKEKQTGLVPFADMLNHKQPPQDTFWGYSDERKGFMIMAVRHIKNG